MASSDIAGGGPPPPPKTSFWDKIAAKAKEVGEQTKEKAIDFKLAADDQLEKARQSDAWQKTKAGAGQAWDKTKIAAMQAHSQVKTAIQGEKKVVTFTETKLGMTLAHDDRSGKPVVSRVDGEGAAAALGVEPNEYVISMRAGVPGDNDGEPEIRIDSYDQLMGLFPAMGRPVTITFLKPREAGPSTFGVVNFSMEDELVKATKIVTKLTTERSTNPDAAIPAKILQHARGLAFIRVAKLGAFLSVKMGTGIVLTRLGEALDNWSAPCAIGTAGLGMGFQWGAELTDFMLVLNDEKAVEAFQSGQQVSLGGNVGIAVGPVGRNVGATANIHESSDGAKGLNKLKAPPVFAYSHSKGLFVGISLEGAVIKPRDDVNEKFYGRRIPPRELLSGMTLPPASAAPLYDTLTQVVSDSSPAATGNAQDDSALMDHHAAAVASGEGPYAEPVVATEPSRSPNSPSNANPFTDASDAPAGEGEYPPVAGKVAGELDGSYLNVTAEVEDTSRSKTDM